MVMIKIGRHYYDVSVAWPLIIVVPLLGFVMLAPAIAWLRAFIAG